MVETLKYSLTESADTIFTEFEKALEDDIGKKRRSNKKGSTTKVMMIRAIVIQWPRANLAADTNYATLQITTNSEAAIVNLSDKDLFFRQSVIREGAITTNCQLNGSEDTVRYVINKPFIKKTMWFGIQTSSGEASTIHVELQFDYKYVSDWQMQRMISRKV